MYHIFSNLLSFFLFEVLTYTVTLCNGWCNDNKINLIQIIKNKFLKMFFIFYKFNLLDIYLIRKEFSKFCIVTRIVTRIVTARYSAEHL